MTTQTYTTSTKQSESLEKLDRIDVGGTHYEIKARYIHNGVVTLDLVPAPDVSPVVFNVRIMLPMYVAVHVINPQ